MPLPSTDGGGVAVDKDRPPPVKREAEEDWGRGGRR
jgi:hypothetical protein